MRIHFVRRTGAPQGEHVFLGYPWWQNGSRGIAWGVLESPSMKILHGVRKAQRAEEEILCLRYLMGATREGSNPLSVDASAPLPLRDLIFFHKDTDLRAWLLANDGKHPLDLMVLESRLEEAEDDRSTPEHVGGQTPIFRPQHLGSFLAGRRSSGGHLMGPQGPQGPQGRPHRREK